MRFQDILRVARRNIAILLGALIIGSAVGLLHATARTPEYESEAKAVVSIGSATSVQDLSQGGTFAEQAVLTYAEIATTPKVLSKVIQDLSLRTTPAALANDVTVSAPTSTSVLTISATDRSPRRAADIANAVTSELAQTITNLTPSRNTVSTVTITQLQTALPSTVPTGPGPLLETLLGGVAGLLLGIGIAVLRQALDTRVRSVHDIEVVTDRPVLGHLVYSGKLRKQPLVMTAAPTGVVAESFRSLRTNLQFLNYDGGAHTIVVTSSLPSEGKSTTVANLAIALADAGRSVVVVDGDLRRPKLGNYFGLVGAAGLTDVLIGVSTIDHALEAWGDNGLRVLTAGRTPPNPSELLQSDSMGALLAELRRGFEYVIVDSPPLLATSDAAVLGRIADGVLLIAGATRVRRGQMVVALRSLEQVGVRVLGVVLNLSPEKGPDAYGYQSYGPVEGGDDGRARSSSRAARRTRGASARDSGSAA